MKTIQALLVSAVILLSYSPNAVYAQVALEAQIAGSNIAGITLSSMFEIKRNTRIPQSFVTSIGLGSSILDWNNPYLLTHLGAIYKIKKWGAGVEMTTFSDHPLKGPSSHDILVDMILYPNLSFTWGKSQAWYYRISAGAYFAFSKQYDYDSKRTTMYFEDDVIPGIGFSLGRRLGCKE